MRPDNAELAFNDPHQRGVLWMHSIGAWGHVNFERKYGRAPAQQEVAL
jgi:hypothetical protein